MQTIKIFISSLFSEMACERDIIHRQINAIISERLKGRIDARVVFIDLRWGVEDRMAADEIERSKHVVNRCFDAIDDCDIFLGVLGNNYGSRAPAQTVERYLGESATRECSYTELEIIHAKKKLSPKNMIFVMKPLSPTNHPEMLRLKREVMDSYACALYEKYDNLNSVSPSFVSGCVELCIKCIESLGPQKETIGAYYYRERTVNECMSLAEKNNFVLIFGSRGSGKSVLMRTLAEKYQNLGASTIYIDASRSEKGLLSKINDLIQANESLEGALGTLKKQILNADKKTVLFLDGADDAGITSVYQLYRKLRSIPSESLTVFLSPYDKNTVDLLLDFDIELYNVFPLGDDEVAPFINTIANIYNKSVYDEFIEYVLQKGDKFRSPFAMDMFLTKIMTAESSLYQMATTGTDGYTNEIIKLLKKEADSFPDEYDDMVDWKIRELERHIYPRFAQFMVELMVEFCFDVPLALAIKTFEIYYSQKWSYVDYYTYKLYLRGILEERDGKLSFVNKQIYRKILNAKRCPLEGIKKAIYEALCLLDIEPIKKIAFEMEIYPERVADSLANDNNITNFAFAFEEFFELGLMLGDDQRAKRLIDTVYTKENAEKLGLVLKTLVLTNVETPSAAHRTDLLVYFLAKIENFITDDLRLELYAAIMRYSVDVGSESYATSVLGMTKKFLFESDKFDSCIASNPELVLDALYGMHSIANAIDASQLAWQCLSLVVATLPLSKGMPEWTPRVIQEYMRIDIQGTESLLEQLSDRIDDYDDSTDSNMLSILVNFLYASYTLQMNKKCIDKMIPIAELLYTVCQKAYMIDNTSEREIYNYSLGLNALAFISNVRQEPDIERQALLDIYKSRCMLCSIDPDSFMYINALTNTTIQIILNNVDIGEDYNEILETVYSFAYTYAKRGNPRIGWLFSSMFSTLCQNDVALHFFMGKLKDVKSFMLPIITYNKSNAENLKKLIECYFSIYQFYCEKQILSLENGRLILDNLYLCAKMATELSPCQEYYEMFADVYREIHAIIVQNAANKLCFEDPIYKDCVKFVKEVCEKDQSTAAKTLGLLPLEMEVLCYIYMLADMKNVPMFEIILERMNIDPYANILQNIEVALGLYKQCDFIGYVIQLGSIQLFLTGAAFVAQEAISPQQRTLGKQYMEILKKRYDAYQ